MPNLNLKKISTYLISLTFISAGIGHFILPDIFLEIMPPQLPLHLEAVYISGIFEILGGIGVLIPRFRKMAGYGLILLLIAIFPANIYMASSPDVMPIVPNWIAIARLPFQFVFIGWIYWATARPVSSESVVPA